MRYKLFLLTNILLFFILAANNSFAQSDDTATSEVIIGDPNQDSTENLLEEYNQYESTDSKKTEFERKENFINDSVEKRMIPPGDVQTMKADEDFWYADYQFEKEKEKERELRERKSIFEYGWVRTLLWIIIIGGFAVAIMLFLHDSNVRLFRKKVSVFGDDQLARESDNIFEINYRERIDKAVKEGNYRLAVRLMFLQMLKTMASRNIIQYKQERTNFDYLMQLNRSPHYENFFRLTRNYEYTWYGNFPVNDEAWQKIKNDFEKFNGMLSVK
jgi:hypothetical protein